MLRRIEQAIVTVPNTVKKAIFAEALLIQGDSMKRTPVLTGALRASHVTHKPVTNGRDISVQIEVGGPSADYAVYVHENLEAVHPVGEAKFLFNAIAHAQPGLLGRVAERIRLA